jgi:hypothetical protein
MSARRCHSCKEGIEEDDQTITVPHTPPGTRCLTLLVFHLDCWIQDEEKER